MLDQKLRQQQADPKLLVHELREYFYKNKEMLMPNYTFDAEVNHWFNLYNGFYKEESKAERLWVKSILKRQYAEIVRAKAEKQVSFDRKVMLMKQQQWKNYRATLDDYKTQLI